MQQLTQENFGSAAYRKFYLQTIAMRLLSLGTDSCWLI